MHLIIQTSHSALDLESKIKTFMNDRIVLKSYPLRLMIHCYPLEIRIELQIVTKPMALWVGLAQSEPGCPMAGVARSRTFTSPVAKAGRSCLQEVVKKMK